MTHNSQINIVNAPCGSGKTHLMCNNIINSTHNAHMIAFPSKQLQEDAIRDYFEGVIPYYLFNEDHSDKSVTLDLINFCSQYPDGKHVVVMTHSTFHGLKDLSILNPYHCHIDELINDMIRRWTISTDWNHTTDKYFCIDDLGIASLSQDALTDTQNNITLNGSDLGELIDSMDTRRLITHYTTRKQNEDAIWEEFVQVFTPYYFPNNTTIYTADANTSAVINIIKNHYSDMINVSNITFESSRTNNYNSDNIHYKYFLSQNNSKTLYIRNEDIYINGLKLLINETSNQDTLLLRNSHISKSLFPLSMISIQHNCEGLNGYDNATAILIQSVRNRTPTESSMLKRMYGLTEQQLFNDQVRTAHQAVMRTALRRPDFNGSITIASVDYRLGKALKDNYFPNLKIQKIGNIIIEIDNTRSNQYNNIKPLTKKEKNRLYYIKNNALAGKYSEIDNIKILMLMDNNRSREIIQIPHIWNKKGE